MERKKQIEFFNLIVKRHKKRLEIRNLFGKDALKEIDYKDLLKNVKEELKNAK